MFHMRKEGRITLVASTTSPRSLEEACSTINCAILNGCGVLRQKGGFTYIFIYIYIYIYILFTSVHLGDYEAVYSIPIFIVEY